MKRVITAVVTLGLLSFAPLALSSPASAETTITERTVKTAQGPQAEAQRKLTFFGKRRGSTNNFFVGGRATPNYRNSTVIIKRANCRRCTNFKPFKQVKTNGQGKYRASIAVPRRVGQSISYIAVVPKRGNYGAKRSKNRYTLTRTS